MSRLKAHDAMVRRKCKRKRTFLTEETAEMAIRHNATGLSTYNCNICGNWHLTSNNKKARNVKQKRKHNPKRIKVQ